MRLTFNGPRPKGKVAAGSEFSYNFVPLRFSKRPETNKHVTALGPRAE